MLLVTSRDTQGKTLDVLVIEQTPPSFNSTELSIFPWLIHVFEPAILEALVRSDPTNRQAQEYSQVLGSVIIGLADPRINEDLEIRDRCR